MKYLLGSAGTRASATQTWPMMRSPSSSCDCNRFAKRWNSEGARLARRIRITCHLVFHGPGLVRELDCNVIFLDSIDLDKSVFPALQRDFCRSVPVRVYVPLVRCTEHDVDAASIGFPTLDPGSEVIVGVLDAPVVLLPERVLRGPGRGIAAVPELSNELLPLFIRLEGFEGSTLSIGDDVGDVFVEPLRLGGSFG